MASSREADLRNLDLVDLCLRRVELTMNERIAFAEAEALVRQRLSATPETTILQFPAPRPD